MENMFLSLQNIGASFGDGRLVFYPFSQAVSVIGNCVWLIMHEKILQSENWMDLAQIQRKKGFQTCDNIFQH